MSDPVQLYCKDTKVRMRDEVTLETIGFDTDGMLIGSSRPDDTATYFANGLLILDEKGRQQFVSHDTRLEIQCSDIFSGKVTFRIGLCAAQAGFYPPPSYAWLYRTQLGGTPHQFFVQAVVDNPSFWLTVVDSSFEPVTAHTIKPHELAKLYMRSDAETYLAMRNLAVRVKTHTSATVLDRRPPANKTVYWRLTRGLQNLGTPKSATSTRDLVEPLVPQSFPPGVRQEYMEFLGMLIHRRLPKHDPMDVFSALAPRGLLYSLYGVQLKYDLEGLAIPPYPMMLFEAERSANRPSGSSPPADAPTWLVAIDSIVDSAPNWTPRALRYLKKTPMKGRLLEFPVTRVDADSDSELAKDRAALMFDGYNLRTSVDYRRMGLEKLVYSGRAHTWPHRHLEKSLELKLKDGREKSLQVMLVPREILARVEENVRRTMRVEFETSVLNVTAYHSQLNTWTAPFTAIRRPPLRLSFSELQKKARWSLVPDEKIPNRDEARVIDLTSSNFYLDMLENPRFVKEYRIDIEKMEATLERLIRKRIVRPITGIRTHNMPTALVEASGDEASVCGLSRALLTGTPRAQLMIGEGGRHAYVTCKVPEYQYGNFVEAVERAAEGLRIAVEVADVLSLTSYMNSLYQRILTRDGTWDTDLSELLSQISFTRQTEDSPMVDY